MPSLTRALEVGERDASWWAFGDPDFEAVNGMYGGWTAAVLLGAVTGSDQSDAVPSALNVNYVARVPSGSELRIRTTELGGSRSIHHWSADLLPADGEQVLATANVVLAARRESDGHTQPAPPPAPEPESLETFHPPNQQGELVDMRSVVGTPPFGRGDASSLAWVRDATGREVDWLQLAYLADQCAPRSFYWSEGPRLSATLTMVVRFLGTPDEVAAVGDDFVLHEATANRGAWSTSDQVARIWSRSGALLATSEQLCWYR